MKSHYGKIIVEGIAILTAAACLWAELSHAQSVDHFLANHAPVIAPFGAQSTTSSGFSFDYVSLPSVVSPGETVEVKVQFGFQAPANLNAVVFLNVFGNWVPGADLARLLDGVLVGGSRSVQTNFTFLAPNLPGVHRLRLPFVEAFAPVTNFFGGPPGGPSNPGIGAYAEITFQVQPLCSDVINPTNELGLLTNAPTSTDEGIATDGRFVVWRDIRNGQHIHVQDRQTGGEHKISESAAPTKYQPRISQGLAVWLEEPSPGHSDRVALVAKDLTGRLWPADAAPRMLAEFPPSGALSLDGDWIAWVQGSTGAAGDVYAQNLVTGERVQVRGPATEFAVVVSDGRVFYATTPSHVWGFGGGTRDWDIYEFDLRTRLTRPVKVGPGSFTVLAAEGNRVLLKEVPAYEVPPNRRLVLLDLATGAEAFIAEGENGSLSGPFVAYQDNATRTPFLYDERTGQHCQVASTPCGEVLIAGHAIVWQSFQPPASSHEAFIYSQTILEAPAFVPPATTPPTITLTLFRIPGTVPVIEICGAVGQTFKIEYSSSMNGAEGWRTLVTVVLSGGSCLHADLSAIGQPKRFYRVLSLP